MRLFVLTILSLSLCVFSQSEYESCLSICSSAYQVGSSEYNICQDACAQAYGGEPTPGPEMDLSTCLSNCAAYYESGTEFRIACDDGCYTAYGGEEQTPGPEMDLSTCLSLCAAYYESGTEFRIACDDGCYTAYGGGEPTPVDVCDVCMSLENTDFIKSCLEANGCEQVGNVCDNVCADRQSTECISCLCANGLAGCNAETLNDYEPESESYIIKLQDFFINCASQSEKSTVSGEIEYYIQYECGNNKRTVLDVSQETPDCPVCGDPDKTSECYTCICSWCRNTVGCPTESYCETTDTGSFPGCKEAECSNADGSKNNNLNADIKAACESHNCYTETGAANPCAYGPDYEDQCVRYTCQEECYGESECYGNCYAENNPKACRALVLTIHSDLKISDISTCVKSYIARATTGTGFYRNENINPDAVVKVYESSPSVSYIASLAFIILALAF